MKLRIAWFVPLLLLLAARKLAAEEGEPAEPVDDELALGEVTVLGRAQTLYQVDRAATGTRTPTKLEDLPQSVQVLPRELMDDQAARQIIDLYRNISGISFL